MQSEVEQSQKRLASVRALQKQKPVKTNSRMLFLGRGYHVSGTEIDNLKTVFADAEDRGK